MSGKLNESVQICPSLDLFEKSPNNWKTKQHFTKYLMNQKKKKIKGKLENISSQAKWMIYKNL